MRRVNMTNWDPPEWALAEEHIAEYARAGVYRVLSREAITFGGGRVFGTRLLRGDRFVDGEPLRTTPEVVAVLVGREREAIAHEEALGNRRRAYLDELLSVTSGHPDAKTPQTP